MKIILHTEVVVLNESNLIRPENLTPDERRESARKAGLASAAARRKRKSMREKMKLLLSLPACDSDLAELEALGIPIEESDNEMVILKGLFLKAANGDVPASKEIRNILGKDNASEELELKKKELKLKEEAMKPADNASTDDGFIEALNNKTEEIWNDE